ncbi:MAG: BamA/TamA family outer membrane protein [Alphaproteobacteria bacterium]|nr:BamA/TamA family outer membrane protein [Alphaproteobacteria bacterium]
MRAVWLLILATLVACTPARRKVRGDIVRDIAFQGNAGVFSGQNDYQLRTQIEQEDSAFGVLTWPMSGFVEPVLLQPDVLVRDAYRLEVWYAHHGWLDARVAGWTIDRVRASTRRKAGVVDVLGRVSTGPRSTVRKLAVTGATGAAGILAKTVMRTAEVHEGDPFDLELVESTRTALQDQLRRSGFAYAKVDLEMHAWPEQQAVDVELRAVVGIPAKLGPITVEGCDRVREAFVRDALNLEEGEPYRLDGLVAAQRRVFAMKTFSLVTVQPDLSDPTAEAVPIRVRVTENKFRSLRFGGGVKAESQNWEPYVSSSFKHTNVFGQLIQFQLGGRFGLSGYTPFNKAASNLKPVWKVNSSVLYPRILHQTVAQQLEVDIERGLDQSLQEYFNPKVDFRSIFKPSDIVVISMGPHVEIFSYPFLEPGSVAGEQAKIVYGEDFVNRYRITSIDTAFTVDWRDDRFSTKRGSFFTTTLRMAFPLQEGDYAFGALSGDWRLFRPVRVRDQVPMTLATRIHGKLLVDLGDAGLPYPELAFLGGASSMRGYPTRSMGPYRTYQPVEGTYRYVPVGGTLGLVLSEELRYYGGYGVTWAVFGDVATLANPGRTVDIRDDTFWGDLTESARFAVGVGARYQSSIGPLRLDFAMRPYADEDCGPVESPLACYQATPIQRRLDAVRFIDRSSSLPAFMIFFAFGEAI